MELHEIREVRETNGDANVNAYLKLGWVIVSKAVKREDDSEWVQFTMGWTKDLPVTYPNV